MEIHLNSINYSLPIKDINSTLGSVIAQIGVNSDILTNAINNLAADLQNLNSRVIANEGELFGYAVPELEAISEKLNQKVDLEFLKRRGARRLLPIIEDTTSLIDTKEIDEWFNNFLKDLGYE